jgi:hypothetical protein
VGLGTPLGEQPLVEPNVRLLTDDDIPWLSELGKRKYGERYDYLTVENWYRNIVLKQPLLFYPMRTKHAFCISMLSFLPWCPGDGECVVVLICADDGRMWEAMHLLRNSIDWGRSRKCAVWKLSGDTVYDLRPMATRVGATEISPRFELRY